MCAHACISLYDVRVLCVYNMCVCARACISLYDTYVCVCHCRTEVGKVWGELASRDPSLLEPFERFLSGVMAELKQSQHDREKLETHMKRSVGDNSQIITHTHKQAFTRAHTHTHTHTHTQGHPRA